MPPQNFNQDATKVVIVVVLMIITATAAPHTLRWGADLDMRVAIQLSHHSFLFELLYSYLHEDTWFHCRCDAALNKSLLYLQLLAVTVWLFQLFAQALVLILSARSQSLRSIKQ